MTDLVFLITGASTGIGAATARQAVQAGYRVVLAARSMDKLHALVDELGGSKRALAVHCDVAEWADQESMIEATFQAFGRLDVAYANTGFTSENRDRRGFLNSEPELWRSMILTNVYGTALTIRATLPMLKASHGHLLLTGSVLGRHVLSGSLYSCTK